MVQEVLDRRRGTYRGTSQKQPRPLRPPYGPRRRPTVGSYGETVSYERGTPVKRGQSPHSPLFPQGDFYPSSGEGVIRVVEPLQIVSPCTGLCWCVQGNLARPTVGF